MKIACTTLACPRWSLEQILKELSASGYDGIDFRGLGDEMEVWKLPAFTTDAEATAGKIAAAGLTVSGFSSSARMFNADADKRAKGYAEVAEYAALCRRFGAPMIRVFGGSLGGVELDRAIDVAAETLTEMAEIAGEGVTVAVETHDDWTASAPLAAVLAKVDRPNVGALWDLHHPYRMEGESPQQTYDNIGRYTVAAHLKDSRLTGKGEHDHEYVLGGEGDVPLGEMVKLLAAGGYDGMITLEWEKKWHPELAGPEVALPAHAKYMRELIAQAQ
ncbi:hypothetical protein LCGC14_1477220 [marine sediment metagenome]|uniref:Xylose isomerase-like TIM barrel domain-containing protein n=1 Tax=marine sediment metagenome TaxID=412755 RepID=A0A0F9JWM9_9ZZZZ